MKTVTIERPAYLPEMSRQIFWSYEDFDLRNLSKPHLQKFVDEMNCIGGGAAAIGSYVKGQQLLSGSIMIVDQRVSRELEASTVTCSLAHLAWPSGSIEMRFADPALPVIIATSAGIKRADEIGVAFVCEAKSGTTMSLCLPDRLWQQYTRGEYTDAMSNQLPGDMPMDDHEAEVMRYMATLAIKVIAYASCPQHAPTLLTTREERKSAGIHPKHVRPTDRVLAVRYLPRIVRDQAPTTSEPTGRTHQFKGRAGHIRYYEADRYVNLKGTWQWLPPISPPEGIHVIYKIRKAPLGSMPMGPQLLSAGTPPTV